MSAHQWTTKIAYVTEDLETVEEKEIRKKESLHICTEIRKPHRPVVLGSGNYAVVVLAASSAEPQSANTFYALKFLRVDTESEIYSEIGQLRFYSEVTKTRIFLSDLPYLVGYEGFGRTKKIELPSKARKDEHILDKIYQPRLDEIEEENKKAKIHEFLEENLKVKLQGEFYVMDAACGTLGDFLLHEFEWKANSMFVNSPRKSDQLSEIVEDNKNLLQATREMLDDQHISLNANDRSGLGILRAVDKANHRFANRAIVRLFVDMIQTVTKLHNPRHVLQYGKSPHGMLGSQEQEEFTEQAGWAHRDIKPANFLMDFSPPDLEYKVQATDLGFVIGASDAGRKETISATKDPGVLALGSYLYRAPEQRESRYEVQFSLKNENPTNELMFMDIGDMTISAGDLFESDDFLVENDDDHHPGVPIRTTIVDTEKSEGKYRIKLESRLLPKASQVLYSGDVVKLTGQHTDLFSLGAALYLMASGGKNPEKFFIKYLEEIPDDTSSETSEFSSIYNSCYKIAMSLCLQPWDEANKDAEELYGSSLTEDDREFMRNYHSSKGGREIRSSRGWFGIGKKETVTQPEKGLALYLTALRSNPMLRYYTTNKNGSAIPFCILFEIVKLMVRDKEHSYIRMSGGNSTLTTTKKNGDSGEDGSSYGYFALDLEDMADNCLESLKNALERSEALEFPEGRYARVANQADRMIFVVRLLFDKLSTPTS